ncbi:hypothetical protein [Streptomyces cucumeris]|uniref:hypothetical protein n=1 Tax=Streptomyces cucumeris TaxID=2962890 RepID=UPI003D70B887
MAAKGLGLVTAAREITPEELTAALALVQRNATSAEDERELLAALGLTPAGPRINEETKP